MDDHAATQADVTPIDLQAPGIADRIVEIQRAAYAVEAELIGFDGIPPLTETTDQVRSRTDLHWRGVHEHGALVGVIAWSVDDHANDIDRLAVVPRWARRGHGRRLVRAVPSDRPTVVSTGTANIPALALYRGEGFRAVETTEIAPGITITHLRREPPAG